jgi:hypothetical protein
MASASAGTADGARAGKTLLACVESQGSAAHPYSRSDELLSGRTATRNLADAVHFLCTLHGRHPGVVDHAAGRTSDVEALKWLQSAIDGFAAERLYLTKLAVAAGPLPSTPGAGDSGGVVLAQRHAIEMLSRSERTGCAVGAALALILDWSAIRVVLDTAAGRLGIEPRACKLPSAEQVEALANNVGATPAAQRAMLFGASQIMMQHKGLWDLLEARQQARAAG